MAVALWRLEPWSWWRLENVESSTPQALIRSMASLSRSDWPPERSSAPVDGALLILLCLALSEWKSRFARLTFCCANDGSNERVDEDDDTVESSFEGYLVLFGVCGFTTNETEFEAILWVKKLQPEESQLLSALSD
ncbi:hypothetical protein OGAPHI_000988 [Ogataea philodendri]|uniref:Uncharacterized protein n=1 Tax=Ogataea philodendri TaxID=1378263 RepID=A0A9P8T8N8_9ASCO|nr:uncharacterized protein OGAPHI_000988 [Ogataea philodendri]KAH3670473.1 hypothetical protein OGAPHI_000988 [Ogataea philodendri]